MEELFREKLKYFLGGTISGALFGGYGLFSIPILGSDVGQLVLQYGIRFAGVAIIALVSGLFTAMLKDFYDIVVKHRATTFFYFINRLLGGKDKNKKK